VPMKKDATRRIITPDKMIAIFFLDIFHQYLSSESGYKMLEVRTMRSKNRTEKLLTESRYLPGLPSSRR